MFYGVMFCPLCATAMSYEKFEDTYRCTKTDFHPKKKVAIVAGTTKFQGSVLRDNEDIHKSLVLVILKESSKGSHDIIRSSEVTVRTRVVDLRLDTV